MMAAILDWFLILRFCLKLRDIIKNGYEIPFYVIKMQNTGNKMKSNDYFSIVGKNSARVLLKSNFPHFLW